MTQRRNVLKALVAIPALATGASSAVAQPQSTSSNVPSIRDFLPSGVLDAIAAGHSDYDCAPAIRAALAQSGGRLYFPAGTYVIGSSIKMLADVAGRAFAPGPWISGDGMGRTIFDNRAGDGPMFDIDSNANHVTKFGGVLGVRLEGFTVISRTKGVPTSAIRLRTAYEARLFQLHIIGQRGDGIRIPCINGDNDGSNMVSLEQVRIENCGGWGLDSAGEAGHNETSFLRLQQVFIQGCGTPSGAPVPPSGGMRHKGQILTLDQCSFTINENVALYVPGQAGLAILIDIASTAFENNHQRQILCTGVSGFKARNIQFFNNDANPARIQCSFDGSQHTVRMVDIDGVVVRATAGNNPCTSFQFKGENLERNNCRIRNVTWDNYDYPGQTRFEGVPFDHVESQGALIAADGATLLYKPAHGNQTPLRLRGAGSTSGEWIAAKLPLNGVYAGSTGLAPNSRYHVYLYDKNGAQALDVSQMPPTKDAESGYPVKSGDAAHLHVGDVLTDSQGRFAQTGTGWLNAVRVPGATPGSFNALWSDGQGRLRLLLNAMPSGDLDGRVVG